MKKVKKARIENLDEIVFENRNKAYGAYQIRKSYDKTMTRALAIALLLLILAVGAPFLLANYMDNRIVQFDGGPFVLDDPTGDDGAVPPPPPPPPPPPATNEDEFRKNVFTAPVVSDEIDSTDMGLLADWDKAVQNDAVDTTSEEPVVIQPPAVIDPPPVDWGNVQEKPEFPGGDGALFSYVASNTVYPDVPKQMGVQGKVYVEFVVDENGNIAKAKVKKEVDPYLDAEAIRVIKSLPKWNPGKQDGHPVKVTMILPINFILE